MSERARQRWSLHSVGSTRRFAWVVALALLLPFAQALAWAHAFSHHGAAAQRADAGAVTSYDGVCATCLGAAPLHGGALPSAVPTLVEPPLRNERPLVVRECVRAYDAPLAYHSRAPPLLA